MSSINVAPIASDMSMLVKDSVMKGLSDSLRMCVRDHVMNAIRKCGSEYGFDSSDAITRFCDNLDDLRIEIAPKVMKEKAAKGPKAPRAAAQKPAFPLPFCGVMNEASCSGLRLEHGLYTQCHKAHIADKLYCKTCQSQADKNANGKPRSKSVWLLVCTSLPTQKVNTRPLTRNS
jgi:hypothetical protein